MSTFPDYIPLGRVLAVLGHHYFGALTYELKALDIDRHYSLLIAVSRQENSSQQNLSSLLGVDKVTMARMVTYLEKKGYVRRLKSTLDRREQVVSLTSKGKKAVPEILKAIEKTDNLLLEGLSAKKKVKLRKMLVSVSENLKSLPADTVVYNLRKAKNKRK